LSTPYSTLLWCRFLVLTKGGVWPPFPLRRRVHFPLLLMVTSFAGLILRFLFFPPFQRRRAFLPYRAGRTDSVIKGSFLPEADVDLHHLAFKGNFSGSALTSLLFFSASPPVVATCYLTPSSRSAACLTSQEAEPRGVPVDTTFVSRLQGGIHFPARRTCVSFDCSCPPFDGSLV